MKKETLLCNNVIEDSLGNKFLIINDKLDFYPDKSGYLIANKDSQYFITKKELMKNFKLVPANSLSYALEIRQTIFLQSEEEYKLLKSQCIHHIINKHDSATCNICGNYFGWYCPDSLDHTCHYYSDNSQVKLINGDYTPVPKNHNADYETDDGCIFCGQPEERK